jgi:hypothetical protein
MTKKLSTPGIVMMLAVITGVLAAAAPRKQRGIPNAPSGVPVPPLAADEPKSWLERASDTMMLLIIVGLAFGVLIVFCTNLLR